LSHSLPGPGISKAIVHLIHGHCSDDGSDWVSFGLFKVHFPLMGEFWFGGSSDAWKQREVASGYHFPMAVLARGE
jgi:hypothetical protein